jgi:hypothetical protein
VSRPGRYGAGRTLRLRLIQNGLTLLSAVFIRIFYLDILFLMMSFWT